MQASESAAFVMRLMTPDELTVFVGATESERKTQAAAAIERYCSILKSSIDDPQWPTAARHACLAQVVRKSAIVRNLLAA